MKSRLLAGPAAIVSTFAAIVLAGTMLVRSPQVRAQNGTNQGSDAARIQQGLAIAPVPLNLVGKDPALVGLGIISSMRRWIATGVTPSIMGSSLRQ